MKIGILSSYGLTGSGSCIYASRLAESLARGGHDVSILAYRVPSDEAIRGELLAAGVRIRDLRTRQVSVTYSRAAFPHAACVAQLDKVEITSRVYEMRTHIGPWLDDHGFDLVIAQHFLLHSHAAALECRIRNTRLVVVSHGTDVEYGIAQSDLLKRLARGTADRASTRVALNPRSRSRLSEVLQIKPDAFDILLPGIDTHVYSLSETTERAPNVVFVGRMILDKGVHVLLGSLPSLIEAAPEARVNLLGAGPDLDAFKALVTALNCGDELGVRRIIRGFESTEARREMVQPLTRALFGPEGAERRAKLRGTIGRVVHFAGHVSQKDVAENLRKARALVLPSLVPECYPLSLVEALSCGCSVATTPLGGSSDVLQWLKEQDQDAGELARIDPGAPIESLSSALPKIVSSWRSARAVAVAEAISARHSWRFLAPQLIDLPRRRVRRASEAIRKDVLIA